MTSETAGAPSTPSVSPSANPEPSAVGVSWREVLNRLTWFVRPNPWPDPESHGADAFEASANELPGSLFFAASPEAALAIAQNGVFSEIESGRMSTEVLEHRGRRKPGAQALVQLNVRVPPEIRERIVKRADEHRMPLARFVQAQCLGAPLYRDPFASPGERMPSKLKSEAIRRAAAHGLREPDSQRREEG